MSQRPPKPDFLIRYEEWIKAGPPKCCHTCEHYGVDGLCVEFFMRPPDDFAATVDACEQWTMEAPF